MSEENEIEVFGEDEIDLGCGFGRHELKIASCLAIGFVLRYGYGLLWGCLGGMS